MESPFYSYFEIRSPEIAGSFDLNWLTIFLDGISEIEKEGTHQYRNKKGFPFFSLHLLFVTSYSNWSSLDIHETKANFITIVSSKETSNDLQKCTSLSMKIAQFLNRELIEETDDGDMIIWQPRNN